MDVASWSSVPLTVAETALQVAFGYRRTAPWISYRAARTLGRLIQPQWRILEFGAGMSTVWFASRAHYVLSIESDTRWYQQVAEMLHVRGLANVQLEYRQSSNVAGYASLPGIADSSFDLALIDGIYRDRCVPPCLQKVRPGGYIYLDNTDQPDHCQAAEAALLATNLEWHRYFTDFSPGLVIVTQGLLAKLSRPTPSAQSQ
jgi:predicted O-methyltransferase YrrM